MTFEVTPISSNSPRIRLNQDHPHEVVDNILEQLRSRIVGQDEGVQAMASSVINGIFPDTFSESNKPLGTLLFLGPTGVGKTQVPKEAARALHGEPKFLRIDCNTLQASHEIASLIGSPPGYVDRDVVPRLHQQFIDEQQSKQHTITIVLFDEIEKGSYRLFNLLLTAMDEGVIKLNDNSTTSFKNCILVFTSNVGAKEMSNLVSTGIGFGSATNKTSSQIRNTAIRAAERRFSPEFLNRFNELVVFNSLGQAEYEKILDLELQSLQARISSSSEPFVIRFTKSAKQLLLSKGIVPKYGARPLKGKIQELVALPLRKIFHTRQIKPGYDVVIDRKGNTDSLEFFLEPPLLEMPPILTTKKLQITAGEFIPMHAKVGKDRSGKAWKLLPGMEYLGKANQNIPIGGAIILKDTD